MKKASVVLSFALLFPAFAFAQVSVRTNADVQVTSYGQSGRAADTLQASTTVSAEDRDERAETGSAKSEDDVSVATNASSTAAVRGSEMAAEHRSAVATFVQSLRGSADRDGGIGAEVRAVAESQNDSASTTAVAIAQVEGRGKIASFLFGTDWKSIGMLRSEIAKGKSDAARLEAAIQKSTDASVKADLEAQLSLMEAEQAKIEAFVEAHANSFSLFGWFTKLFVKAEAEAA